LTVQTFERPSPIQEMLGVVGPLRELIDLVWWTDAVPRSYKWSRRDGDFPEAKTKALMLASALLGNAMGVDPFRSWANIHPTGQGRFAIAADFKVGLALAAGCEFEVDKREPEECVIRARRRGAEHWSTIRLTMADAKQAGWTSNNLYDKVPGDMLYHRASGRAADMVAAHVTLGIVTYEDYADVDDSDNRLRTAVRETLAARDAVAAIEGEVLAQRQPGDTARRSIVGRLVDEAEQSKAPPVTPTERVRELRERVPHRDLTVRDHQDVQVEEAGPEEAARIAASLRAVGRHDEAAAWQQPEEDEGPAAVLEEEPQKIDSAMWARINAAFVKHAITGIGQKEARLRVIKSVVGREIERGGELNVSEAELVLDNLGMWTTPFVKQLAYPSMEEAVEAVASTLGGEVVEETTQADDEEPPGW
jgi:hypothetical protein